MWPCPQIIIIFISILLLPKLHCSVRNYSDCTDHFVDTKAITSESRDTYINIHTYINIRVVSRVPIGVGGGVCACVRACVRAYVHGTVIHAVKYYYFDDSERAREVIVVSGRCTIITGAC